MLEREWETVHLVSCVEGEEMKIFIDADACPVKQHIMNAAATHGLSVCMIFSTSHHGNTSNFENAEKIMVDNESQAADMAIMNRVSSGDIVVTGDFGLASLVLSKNAYAISFSGRVFDENNIDRLLLERHLSQVLRRSGGKTKGPLKRKREDDLDFQNGLNALILKNMKDI